MEITLCDYDFSGLYEGQKKAFDRTALPKYIDPDQVPGSGAVWCIDGFYLSDNGNFSQKVQQYGLWSREQSGGRSAFASLWRTWTSSCPKAARTSGPMCCCWTGTTALWATPF